MAACGLAAGKLREVLDATLAPCLTREEFRTELKAALEPYATKDDVRAMRDELRTHFDAVYERFRDESKWLYEWGRPIQALLPGGLKS